MLGCFAAAYPPFLNETLTSTDHPSPVTSDQGKRLNDSTTRPALRCTCAWRVKKCVDHINSGFNNWQKYAHMFVVLYLFSCLFIYLFLCI